MKLIGLTGKIGSGKTAFANYLQHEHGYGIISFATPLKKAASALFQINIKNFYDSDKKETVNPFWKITPREMLQKLGMSCREKFSINFFVKNMELAIQKNKDIFIRGIVIDDVRFLEESKLICEMDGDIIKIIRPDNPYDKKDIHESENIDIIYDHIIGNNTDISTFHKQIDILIGYYNEQGL